MLSRIYFIALIALILLSAFTSVSQAQQMERGNSGFIYNGIDYSSIGSEDPLQPMYTPSAPRNFSWHQVNNCRAKMNCGSISTTISGTTCESCMTCDCTVETRDEQGRWSAITGSPFSNEICGTSTMPSSPTPAQRRACRNGSIQAVEALITGEWNSCKARCN